MTSFESYNSTPLCGRMLIEFRHVANRSLPPTPAEDDRIIRIPFDSRKFSISFPQLFCLCLFQLTGTSNYWVLLSCNLPIDVTKSKFCWGTCYPYTYICIHILVIWTIGKNIAFFFAQSCSLTSCFLQRDDNTLPTSQFFAFSALNIRIRFRNVMIIRWYQNSKYVATATTYVYTYIAHS